MFSYFKIKRHAKEAFYVIFVLAFLAEVATSRSKDIHLNCVNNNWTRVCGIAFCATYTEVIEPKINIPIAKIGLIERAEQVSFFSLMPYDPIPVQLLKLSNGSNINMRDHVCRLDYCFVATKITKELADQIKRADCALYIQNIEKEQSGIAVSMKGLEAALGGDAIPAEHLAAGEKQVLEALESQLQSEP